MFTTMLIVSVVIIIGPVVYLLLSEDNNMSTERKSFILFVVVFGILLFYISTMIMFSGSSAELSVLKKGRVYKVVAIYEKYIVVEQFLSKKSPMFIHIGDKISEDFINGDLYVKTDKLEKIK